MTGDLSRVYSALRIASRLADRAWHNATGATAINEASADQQIIADGLRAYDRLSSEMATLRPLKAAASRDYDRYVTRSPDYADDERTGCSCHISAPCSFCTRETDEAA